MTRQRVDSDHVTVGTGEAPAKGSGRIVDDTVDVGNGAPQRAAVGDDQECRQRVRAPVGSDDNGGNGPEGDVEARAVGDKGGGEVHASPAVALSTGSRVSRRLGGAIRRRSGRVSAAGTR